MHELLLLEAGACLRSIVLRIVVIVFVVVNELCMLYIRIVLRQVVACFSARLYGLGTLVLLLDALCLHLRVLPIRLLLHLTRSLIVH